MRIINWIELENFKSFGGKTRITFPEGLNVIIGPNGSGKSNISDAICFVLGRSSKRELRAEKYGEFLFNGGKFGKPADYAKVTISINNENRNFPIDSDEIIISRRVDKEGRTTYRVNGERQVIDYVKTILKEGGIDPDGYSIILQGSILRISDLSPKERRELIESIAGISFYEDRKHKSELELKKVENKMREVRIILAEKIKYMKELEDEKKNAEKFLELKKRLEYKEKELLVKQRSILEKSLSKIEKEISELNEKKEGLENKKGDLEEEKKEIENKIENINREIEKMGGEKQIEISKKISQIRSKISNITFIIENHKKEISRIRERREQLSKEIKNLESIIEEKKRILESFGPKIENLDEEISKLERTISSKKDMARKVEEIKKEIADLEIQIVKNEEIRKRLEEIKSIQKKREEIISMLSKIPDIEKEINEKIKVLNEKKKELNELLSKRVHFKQKKFDLKMEGVYGRVDDLCKIKDYTKAIDAFAGNKWDWVVVKDVETARKCIKKLKEEKKGIFTFVPLDKIKYKEVEPPCDVIGRITDFLEYDKKFDKLFRFLFGNVFIVKNIPNDMGYKFVTVDGEVIGNYTITGGYRISRHEAIKIEKRIEELKFQISELEKEIDELRERDLENKKREYELKAELSRIPKFDENSYDLILNAIENLKKRREELSKELESLELGNYDEIERKLSDLMNERNGLILEKKSIEGELNNILIKDKVRTEEIMKQIDKQEAEFKKEIESLKDELENLKKEEGELIKEESKFKNELKEMYSKRERLIENVRKINESIVKVESEIRNLINKVQDLTIERAKLSAEIEGLKQKESEYEVEVVEAKDSVEKIREDIEKLKKKISEFGPVNMRALEIFNEVKKEYDEIKEKFDKIIEERSEILKTIEEIDSKKREVFLNTLHEISYNLNHIFNKITGGEARLEVDEENPFESGVFMKIKFPGKKILTTRSMSGGEKSIVALALIFALQASNPSTFYFLDEADTALDKLNSERFANILKDYSKNAQIIVISHNDAVMIKADHLFGVSMDRNGISKVVSLELPQ